MPSNISHCLFALAVCGFVDLSAGLPPLSTSIFVAGLAALLINLDCSAKDRIKRTPWLHSVPSAMAASSVFALVAALLMSMGADPSLAVEVCLGTSVAFATHLALDFLTKEGIYVFSGGGWRRVNASLIGIVPKSEEDALLNVYICIPSAVAVLFLIGLS